MSAVRLLPFFLLGAASGLFTAWLEIAKVGASGEDWDLDLGRRVLLAPQVLWLYLGKLVFPVDLTFSYRRWTIDPSSPIQYLPLAGSLV